MSYFTDNGKHQKLLDKLVFSLNVTGESANLLGAALTILREWYENSIPAEDTIKELRRGKYKLSEEGYKYFYRYFDKHDSRKNKSYEDLVSKVVLLINKEKTRTGQDKKLNYRHTVKAKPKVKAKVSFESPEINKALEFLIADVEEKQKTKSPCPKNKILNPKTGRCVLRTGKIGQKLLGK